MGVNEYIKIGSRIKAERKLKKMSQRELAKEIGIPYSTYSNYENDNREPPIGVIEEVARILDCTMSYLITGEKYFTDDGLELDMHVNEKELSKSIEELRMTVEKGLGNYAKAKKRSIEKLAETAEKLEVKEITILNNVAEAMLKEGPNIKSVSMKIMEEPTKAGDE